MGNNIGKQNNHYQVYAKDSNDNLREPIRQGGPSYSKHPPTPYDPTLLAQLEEGLCKLQKDLRRAKGRI